MSYPPKATAILVQLLADVIPSINETVVGDTPIERELLLEIAPGNHIFILLGRKADGEWYVVDCHHERTVYPEEGMSSYEFHARKLIDDIILGNKNVAKEHNRKRAKEVADKNLSKSNK
jgi:hypothetical protein